MATKKKKKPRIPKKQAGDDNGGGRPTKLNEEVIKILEGCFEDGLTVEIACDYAKITHQTYYNWCEQVPGFLQRMNFAKSFCARQLIKEERKKNGPSKILRAMYPKSFNERFDHHFEGGLKIIIEDYTTKEQQDAKEEAEAKTKRIYNNRGG